MFEKYGAVGRVVLPPARTIALIEYLEVTEAKKGFRSLAYKNFYGVPLYLEWAPINIFETKATKPKEKEKNEEGEEEEDTKEEEEEQADEEKIDKESLKKEVLLESYSEDTTLSSTLYIKNLNFRHNRRSTPSTLFSIWRSS